MNDRGDVFERFTERFPRLKAEIAKKIVGQEEIVHKILLSVLAGGHALLVGVPGLAKTLMIQTLAEALDLSFSRIQFTPDLMPSDILGSEILDADRRFKFIKGPVFANIVLADEINRTPPKTQSALLEAMQEKKVTVSGKDYLLDRPFFVLATQNPIEQEGTYPLPEAQLDRFMFSLYVDYPTAEEEVEIVTRTTGGSSPKIEPVLNKEDILALQQLVRDIPVTPHVVQYAVNVARRTRPGREAPESVNKYLRYGAGPRASQYMILGAKAHALTRGKLAPDIEDVRYVAPNVLRHRILKNYKAEAEGISEEAIIEEIL
ncbi:MAG: AAA domain-containing protein [Chlorobi bacterium]|nr:AAA domain-containing protein [Chlorobiota bacterium]